MRRTETIARQFVIWPAALVLIVAAFALGSRSVSAVSTGASKGSITVGGMERTYRLYVPTSASRQGMPILFAFHGISFDSSSFMASYTKLDELAEEKGFIVAYPDAVDSKNWGLTDGTDDKDMAFFDALYAELGERYAVDKGRVYLAGMSNGCAFVQVLAAQRPSLIAAVLQHSCGLPAAIQTGKIKVGGGYAVMVVNGADDRIVPSWRGKEAAAKYEEWGHDTVYIEVPGLKHEWATPIGINRTMWDFFLKHGKGAGDQAKEGPIMKTGQAQADTSQAAPSIAAASSSAPEAAAEAGGLRGKLRGFIRSLIDLLRSRLAALRG